MALGLTESQIRQITSAIRATLAPAQAARIWLWGSRARGDHRQYSDADIAVEATPPWTATQKAAASEVLEESEIPFRVDLVAEPEIVPAYRPAYLADRREI